ncbi:hypothetical protein [uncultured Leifsonia sp.]|uniref:hypothetical protein n=1 Tax=uncultured Leifsonia sp. TaxID=340359 RepID=UPI0028D0ED4D|nr:hypothetical protein [uncultured Leifsonia sp.]
MSAYMTEFDRIHRTRVRVAWLIVLAVVAGLGAWLTAPFGIVQLTRGDAAGWLLVAAGAVLLAACVVAIVLAVRLRVAPQSLPGRPNPAFDEPQPSKNPNGGYSLAGTQLGSH